MHILKVAHRDIKPTNIMFSRSYNKTVLIDFGGSKVINEPMGVKTYSGYFGTKGFCSNEMVSIINDSRKCVDLYYNDVFGLVKTISD